MRGSNGGSTGNSCNAGESYGAGPKLWRQPAVADARAISTTFWDLI